MTKCRLYLITPPQIDDVADFARQLDLALTGGDVACLQVRLKDQAGQAANDQIVISLAERLLSICQKRDVALLINDRPDLAKIVGADGVHIGQSDASYDEARALLGDAASIGVTCHDSRHLGLIAGEAGADYVAFGAFYPTATKLAPTRADPALLTWWSDVTTIPCVAIGGINAENCGPLVRAGADFIAASAAVWRDPDGPQKAVEKLNQAISAAR